MSAPSKILAEMDNILDQLIGTAEKLRDLSRQVFEEEDLIKLQQAQDTMVNRLMELDDSFKKASKGQSSKSHDLLRQKIDQKIDQFQNLNASFIENIKSSRGVLEFGKKKKTK